MNGVRPGLLFIGCGTSADNIDQIVWRTWTATDASGIGVHNIDNCKPDCAFGTYSSYPVAVDLSNPGYVSGVPELAGIYMFRNIALTPNGKGGGAGGAEPVTIPPGGWGFVPNS